MTTPVQSMPNPIWNAEDTAKIEQAKLVATEIRSTIDKAVRVLSKCPHIIQAYPILSTFTSTLRGINTTETQPESTKVLELEKFIAEILEGKSVKENFENLGKFLIPFMSIDLNKATAEEIIELRDVFEKWVSHSKNPDILNLLMNRNLLELFTQEKDLPNEITEEYLKEQLKSFDQCYEAASSLIMVTHVKVIQDQKHVSRIDETHVLAALTFSPNPKFEYTSHPMGIGLALRSLAQHRNQREIIIELLSDTEGVQEAFAESKKIEDLAEEFLKNDDPEKVKRTAVQILDSCQLHELPVDIRLKTLICLTETQSEMASYFKAKTMRFVESLLEKPKVEEKPQTGECIIQ